MKKRCACLLKHALNAITELYLFSNVGCTVFLAGLLNSLSTNKEKVPLLKCPPPLEIEKEKSKKKKKA